MYRKRKTLLTISIFLLAGISQAQISFNLSGTDFTVKGKLISEFIDRTLEEFGELSTIKCYLEVTKDSLIYHEIEYRENEILKFSRFQLGLKNIQLAEKPIIYANKNREIGKIFYQLRINMVDLKENITMSSYDRHGNNNIHMLTNVLICFPTEEKAIELNNQLLKNK